MTESATVIPSLKSSGSGCSLRPRPTAIAACIELPGHEGQFLAPFSSLLEYSSAKKLRLYMSSKLTVCPPDRKDREYSRLLGRLFATDDRVAVDERVHVSFRRLRAHLQTSSDKIQSALSSIILHKKASPLGKTSQNAHGTR